MAGPSPCKAAASPAAVPLVPQADSLLLQKHHYNHTQPDGQN
jgi:hypothetical protein